MLRCALLTLFALFCVAVAQGQTDSTKVYRGTLGDKHIEMRLNVTGAKVSGTYFYDQFRQDITLEGAYDPKGALQLVEGTGKKKTGKFVCKAEPESIEADLECDWSRPDGKGQAFVYLTEQGIRFKSDIKIVPKIVSDRKTKAYGSLPQVATPVLTPGMISLNKLIESKVMAAMKDFDPEEVANSSYDTNYNVMWATDDIISLEFDEYSDVGAAHPNTRLWTINYNLKTNKQLTLADVFTPNSNYVTEVAKFVTKDINRRADKLDEDEARRNNTPLQKRHDPVMTEDGLPDMDTWALTPKGFAAYFDFPHVMAVFDKTIVPYGMLARYLRADGVVPMVR
ncbi:MAG TPA: DUF3298 domain-containing protein [Pyrinomonadaceae bacterium]